MGSWVTYGLGSENQDLPGFIVLISSGSQPNGGKNSFGSGFLPIGLSGRAVPLRRATRCSTFPTRRAWTARLRRHDARRAQRPERDRRPSSWAIPKRSPGSPSTSWPFACRPSVPEVMDISREPKAGSRSLRGQPGAASFANNCLLARRLVEQGVRFVQLFDWGWDFHGTEPGEDIRDGLTKKMRDDGPSRRRLIKDLKQRGLLDETLVVWIGGEFGRTPFREGRTAGSSSGRDHYPDSYTMLLAGGGVKRGFTYGGDRRTGLSMSPRTRSTSTTCKPRSCTCSASTTRGSPIASKAAITA